MRKIKDDYDICSYVKMERERKYRLYLSGSNAAKLLDELYRNVDISMMLDRKYRVYLSYKNNLAHSVGDGSLQAGKFGEG